MFINVNMIVLVGYCFSCAGACQDRPAATSCGETDRPKSAPSTTNPMKKRKIDSSVQQNAPLQSKVYFNNQILPFIQATMVKEEGKLWAAMYSVTSDTMLSWWAMRRYIQEFEKARQANDIVAIMNADQFKTSPKEDILIVDKFDSKDSRSNMFHLQKFAETGIRVLMRTKDRLPTNFMQTMHNKFMIFFHKNSDQGKIVLTGSFNLTNQAANYNWENMVIVDDPAAVAQFIAEHKDIATYCNPIPSGVTVSQALCLNAGCLL